MRHIRPWVRYTPVLLLAVLMVLGSLPVLADSKPIRIDRDRYSPGEQITVHFAGSPGDDHDWVCIVPAEAPDDEAGDYQYLPRRQAEGDLTFSVPLPGSYEVRIYYGYRSKGYVVTDRCRFTVGEPVAAPPVVRRSAESPAGTPSAKGAALVGMAVFQFTPLNLEASPYGVLAGRTIADTLAKEPSFVTADRKDLEGFLVANDIQQNDRTDNMLLVGARMGLAVVIAGNVEKKGTLIITQYKAVDVGKQGLLYTHRSSSVGETELVRDLQRAAEAIRDAILHATR